LRIAECGMRIVDCGLRNAECGLWIAECGLRNADCGLRINPRHTVPLGGAETQRLVPIHLYCWVAGCAWSVSGSAKHIMACSTQLGP